MEIITLPVIDLDEDIKIINIDKPIINNSTIQLDLSNLNFSYIAKINEYGWAKTEINQYDIININIDWGDDTQNIYDIPIIRFEDEEIILKNNSWYKNICEHTYNIINTGFKTIKITIIDSINNIYKLEINVDVIPCSISDLDITFDIKKAIYNGKNNAVIMKINDEGNNFEHSNTPIVAVLT